MSDKTVPEFLSARYFDRVVEEDRQVLMRGHTVLSELFAEGLSNRV